MHHTSIKIIIIEELRNPVLHVGIDTILLLDSLNKGIIFINMLYVLDNLLNILNSSLLFVMILDMLEDIIILTTGRFGRFTR